MRYYALLITLLVGLASCSNVGEDLPTFQLQTLDGKTITEKDLLGKVTVINVWATWCGNCRNELDALNALEANYHNNPDVVFLAIADEDPEKLTRFLAQRPFNYVHIPNGTGLTDILQTRLVKTYPQHIVLDKNLHITYEYSGELNAATAVLGAAIDHNLLLN